MVTQLVLVPLLVLFSWGYVAHRPASPRLGAMAAFDVVVLVLAAALSGASSWWILAGQSSAGHSIWPVVMATVSTFHVFPGVLLLGWYLRRRLFAGDTGRP